MSVCKHLKYQATAMHPATCMLIFQIGTWVGNGKYAIPSISN